MVTFKERTEQVERGENIEPPISDGGKVLKLLEEDAKETKELNQQFQKTEQGLAGVEIGEYKLVVSNDLIQVLLLDKNKDVHSSFDIPPKGFTNEFRNKIVKELTDFEIIKKKKEALKIVADAFKPLRESYSERQAKKQHDAVVNKGVRFGGVKIDNYLDNAQRVYEEQPYFYDKQNIWWLWNENKWEMTDDTDMERMLDDRLGFMGQSITSSVRKNHLTAMTWVGRENHPKDAPVKWIQFKDKAFSLSSGEIYQVTPHYFFCNPIPWEMGVSDDTPTMDKLFEEWVGKEYVQTLYEIIAYCCLRDYPIHLMFCLIGVGRNGKSRFLALLTKFIGKDNVCSTELDTLLDSRFESFKLYKKLACEMGETNFGLLSKTSLLKRLCGQDMIGFEFKNKQPFDDYSYAKILISSNALPSSADTSEGFYRRWLIVDFPNTFPEGEDILKIVPESEYNNLAKKVTQILPKLLERKTFINQGTVKERQERYIAASNPLSLFIEENCKRGTELYMKYSELYLAYVKYLLENKRRKISRKEFKNVLDDEGLDVSKTTKYPDGSEPINGYFIDGVEMVEDIKNSDLLQFDPKVIQHTKCNLHDCHEYETNLDSENKPFCSNHWEVYAKK